MAHVPLIARWMMDQGKSEEDDPSTDKDLVGGVREIRARSPTPPPHTLCVSGLNGPVLSIQKPKWLQVVILYFKEPVVLFVAFW